jgi:hypothetical protein
MPPKLIEGKNTLYEMLLGHTWKISAGLYNWVDL